MYPGNLQQGFKVNNKKNRRLYVSPAFLLLNFMPFYRVIEGMDRLN